MMPLRTSSIVAILLLLQAITVRGVMACEPRGADWSELYVPPESDPALRKSGLYEVVRVSYLDRKGARQSHPNSIAIARAMRKVCHEYGVRRLFTATGQISEENERRTTDFYLSVASRNVHAYIETLKQTLPHQESDSVSIWHIPRDALQFRLIYTRGGIKVFQFTIFEETLADLVVDANIWDFFVPWETERLRDQACGHQRSLSFLGQRGSLKPEEVSRLQELVTRYELMFRVVDDPQGIGFRRPNFSYNIWETCH